MLRIFPHMALVALIGCFLVACSDDYGTACELPNTASIQNACSPDEESDTQPSCAFFLSSQCSSRICAVYRGSEPFCSQVCETNDDCPGDDFCEEDPRSGRLYCIAL